MQLTTGQYRSAGQIIGSYRCLALLGEGGMGHVYLAEHTRLGRKVALKRLKDRVATEPEAVAQFMIEAQAVNRIHHPHIVDITDFCNDDSGIYYLMELLEGQTVADLLRSDGPLSERRVLYIGHQIADALEAAHRADVLHLDIKPSNIFLVANQGQADFAKLLDFGIARLRDAAGPRIAQERPEDMGPVTPAFMAPEQATTRPVDHRTDIYSLGAVLYSMLAGRPPFDAQTLAEFVHKHLNVVPAPLSGLKDLPAPISAPCSRLVMRCLQKRPADRPQSARELRDLLSQVSESSCGIRLVPGRAPETTPRRGSWRRVAILSALAAVLIAAVAGYFTLGTLYRGKTRRAGGGAKVHRGAMTPVLTPPRETTSLLVESVPPGAEVYREDSSPSLLGLTPLRLSELRAQGSLVLRLKLSGYRSQTVRVELTRARQRVAAALVRVPPPGVMAPRMLRPMGPRPRIRQRPRVIRPRPPMRAMGMDTGSTVDPFAR